LQKKFNGYSGSRYTTQIWHVIIQILGAKLQGFLQLDMPYATISVFGQPKKLYKETLMKYVVSSQERPQNFPIYLVHPDMDSFILYNAETNHSNTLEVLAAKPKEIKKKKIKCSYSGNIR